MDTGDFEWNRLKDPKIGMLPDVIIGLRWDDCS